MGGGLHLHPFARFPVQARVVGDLGDERGDIFPENRGQLVTGRVRVFDRVMQQSGHDKGRVGAVGGLREEQGHFGEMVDIGLGHQAFAPLARVLARGEIQRPGDAHDSRSWLSQDRREPLNRRFSSSAWSTTQSFMNSTTVCRASAGASSTYLRKPSAFFRNSACSRRTAS